MVEALGLLAQSDNGGGAIAAVISLLILLIELGIFVVIIAGMWKTFAKAGQPGWAAIVPIYNVYVLCKVGGRPGWWLILFFIPFVNVIIAAILSIDIAKAFGKGIGFGVGLWLLGFIFYPILGFGSAQYQGPAAA
jgi:hypothetical protein